MLLQTNGYALASCNNDSTYPSSCTFNGDVHRVKNGPGK